MTSAAVAKYDQPLANFNTHTGNSVCHTHMSLGDLTRRDLTIEQLADIIEKATADIAAYELALKKISLPTTVYVDAAIGVDREIIEMARQLILKKKEPTRCC